jgi:hypothetical protein
VHGRQRDAGPGAADTAALLLLDQILVLAYSAE